MNYFYLNYFVLVVLYELGGSKVQAVPQPDADCDLLIRASGWNRLSKNIHGACFTNNLKAVPVLERCNNGPNPSRK